MLHFEGAIKDYIREHLQVDFAMPSIEIHVWNNQVLTETPRVLRNVKSFSWDRREDSLASEITFVIEDTDGTKSPHYLPEKFPHLDLERSGYQFSLYPENKIVVWLGYGDERIQVFTGVIDKVKVNADSSELEVTARDNMKYLLDQQIIPEDAKELIYEYDPEAPLLMSALIADLINKAGLIAEVEESKFDDGTAYTITTDVKFELGTRYIDAIKELTDSIGFKIYATNIGTIRAERNIYPSGTAEPTIILKDYVNLGSSDFVIDTQDARDTIIIASDTGWEEFENKQFVEWLRPTFSRAAKITIPWADTPQKRKLAAQSAFAMMLRVTRRLSVAAVAHPALQIGDIARLSERVSTASDIYRITSIKTELSDGMFFDTIELEGFVNADYVSATSTGRYFGQATATWKRKDVWLQPRESYSLILDMRGVFSQARISIHSAQDASILGATINMLKSDTGWLVTSDFSYDALLEQAKPATPMEDILEPVVDENGNQMYDPGDPSGLIGRGIPTYEAGLELKNIIQEIYGGQILYLSNANPAPVDSSFIALIKCTTQTKTFPGDQIKLTILNITGYAGLEPSNRMIGWEIKSICF